jgi:hypothetical protein
VIFTQTLLHKLKLARTAKPADTPTAKKMLLNSSSIGSGIATCCTLSAKAKETEVSAAGAFAETNENAYEYFTKAAKGISLTLGSEAIDYRVDQREDLKPMRHSIRISKKPTNRENLKLRLWKLHHLGAVKMLQDEQREKEKPIDAAMIARIQGAVFKTLRPRSIQMHLEARRLYRIRKRKEEKEKLSIVFKVTKQDVGRKHQQWLEALDELERKPVEAPMEEVREYPVMECHCW